MIFIIFFAIEMALKLFAYGVRGYVSDSWNRLDGTVVISSLLSLAIPQAQLLRSLRVLRPLRIMSVNEGMRVIVFAISCSATSIFNVLVVCTLFWMIFAIMGVSFFSGQFRYCTVKNDFTEILTNCTANDGELVVHPWNFDNTPNALLTVFEISALEIWPDIMFAGIDANGQSQEPSRDKQPWMGAWFMLLVFSSSLFLVNLFVGVVVDNFKRASEEQDGTVYLTQSQRKWLATQRAVFQENPQYVMKPPTNPWRAKIFNLVEAKWFSDFIFSVIILNVIFMAFTHHRQSEFFTTMLETANYIFTGIFVVEAILKITGLGWSYFKDNWNRFDISLVCISVVTLFVDASGPLSMLRIFRVFRIVRLIRKLKGLSSLLTTLILSMPSIANVGSLIFLQIFVYAILGMEFFYDVEIGDDGYINDHTKFTNFMWSFLTLFRALTGESWNGIMHDTMSNPGGKVWAWFYWVSFEILGAFMLLNLFVAIVIDHFEESRKLQGPDVAVEGEDIENFKVAWQELDDNADGYIRWDQLEQLLHILGAQEELRKKKVVFGIESKPKSCSRRMAFLFKLRRLGKIPVRDGMIHFPEVIYYLSKTALEEKVAESPRFEKLDLPKSRVREEVEKEFDRSKRKVQAEESAFHLDEYWAGSILVRSAQRYIQLKRDREVAEAIAAAKQADEDAFASQMLSKAMSKDSKLAPTMSDSDIPQKKPDIMAEIGLPPPPRRRKHGPLGMYSESVAPVDPATVPPLPFTSSGMDEGETLP